MLDADCILDCMVFFNQSGVWNSSTSLELGILQPVWSWKFFHQSGVGNSSTSLELGILPPV